MVPHPTCGRSIQDRYVTRPSATVSRTTPGSSIPISGVFDDRDASAELSTRHLASGSNRTRSAVAPSSSAPLLADDHRRSRRQRRQQRRELELPGLDGQQAHRERRLQADEPGCGLPERHQLAFGRVRSVIGRDRVDGAVAQALEQRERVVARRQRRVDAAVAVVRALGEAAVPVAVLPGEPARAGDPLVGERDVMRRHVGRHRGATALGLAHQLDGAGGSRGA